MNRERTVLTFEAFTDLLRDELDLTADPPWTMTDRLVEDLAFDSLQLFELVLVLELVGDFEFPEELIDEIATIGDAYEWFAARAVPTASVTRLAS